jgi:hypothetical protein
MISGIPHNQCFKNQISQHFEWVNKNQISQHFEWVNKNLLSYIPIYDPCLDTVDFIECDLIFRITTLSFSDSVSPLSETDDVKMQQRNVFCGNHLLRHKCKHVHKR